MKTFLALLFAGLFLLGCEGHSLKNVSHHEKIVLVDDAIAATAMGAAVALEDGYITVKQACVVHEYGRLAGVIVDQAWISLFQKDYENVEHYLERAREALAGVTEEAQERAKYACAGNRE